ncbi:RND family efflux transporter [Sulfurimonas gotlandica GD1]|uniref:RND family efflux transporter n=1 Tax=Sulfurimonas gotlandica (strain DSM 19862 / JCM 16533 / GD1) TaxID=929558 RepID=B6BKT8_SULGG|nr:efflux RND transporter permease subunit [Sulfurimonas gotlandica]EDZ62274.1 acriflavin resistance protein D [Sulfurimonas gotlandica GD1]EHP29148.1 RND family efflux transporter [Sulfurimonas gotlandica GD1]
MNLIDISIKKPVSVFVGIVLIMMFGLVALTQLPYKLTPNVIEPEIGVVTLWPGATPSEVERDIVEKQEEQLKSTPGLVNYEATASDNLSEITLTFEVGTDMNKALLEVSNKLNQVDTYPENVQKPIIQSAGSNASPTIWMGFVANEGNDRDVDTYLTYLDNEVKEQFERVKGVASIFVPGGTKDELHIKLFPQRLAAHGLTIDAVASAIGNENVDTAAGTVDIDRRTYRVRTSARFTSIQELEQMVLFNDGQKSIRLGDVAEISKGYEKVVANILQSSGDKLNKALIYGVRMDPSANVVETTNRVEEVVTNLNKNVLPAHNIHLEWYYDQRGYIQGAIDLVQQNIAVGAVLAIIILLLFLRSFLPTAVVSAAIPISIVATFIVLNIMDRSLNTISLAGISFAVGMLLDSAIVVLENIDRHLKMGKKPFDAAHDGTVEVWGALVASALTTIAVFLPVIFLESEAGQLFKDIAIAVTAAITFSLFVSISVIPMFWTQLIKMSSKDHEKEHEVSQRPDSFLVSMAKKIAGLFMSTVVWSLKRRINQFIMILFMASISVATIMVLFPKMEYLPQGNQNLIMNILIPPPGLSENEKKDIGHKIYEYMKPHYKDEVNGIPPIKESFYVSFGDLMIQGMISKEESRSAEYIPFMMPIVNSFPGVFGISLQSGVFEQGIGEGRNIDIDISGQDISKLTQIGGMLFGAISGGLQGAQVRPVPSIELLFPEALIIPDRNSLANVGMSSRSFGFAADVLLDGRKISEYTQDGEKSIDMILKSHDSMINSPEALYLTQVTTPKAGLVPMSELSELKHTTSITKIRHVDGKRTITLQVTPPTTMTLEESVERLEKIVKEGVPPAMLQDGTDVKLAGKADKLAQTIESMKWNLVFALAIIYLLMSALFGNFIYPLVILFTVPMATAGGFVGLKLTNMFIAPQPLDVLTMLGFIILIGIVVNNAILIVHQSLNNIRHNSMNYKDGIIEATRSRLRPIFMSSLTSVFGMLPLVLIPGPGSEFYRGLGSVITGGLALSMLFTILVTPALMYLMLSISGKKEKEI